MTAVIRFARANLRNRKPATELCDCIHEFVGVKPTTLRLPRQRFSRCENQRRVQRRNTLSVATFPTERIPVLHGPGFSRRDNRHPHFTRR